MTRPANVVYCLFWYSLSICCTSLSSSMACAVRFVWSLPRLDALGILNLTLSQIAQKECFFKLSHTMQCASLVQHLFKQADWCRTSNFAISTLHMCSEYRRGFLNKVCAFVADQSHLERALMQMSGVVAYFVEIFQNHIRHYSPLRQKSLWRCHR